MINIFFYLWHVHPNLETVASELIKWSSDQFSYQACSIPSQTSQIEQWNQNFERSLSELESLILLHFVQFMCGYEPQQEKCINKGFFDTLNVYFFTVNS